MESFASRQKQIMQTSAAGIIVNLLLAGAKATAGLASRSQSLLSDAANNLSDSLSSILTIIGTALSARKPDAAHPFGYGRLEYMTNFIIAALVLVTGIETLVSSIQQIFHPQSVDYTWVSFTVIGISALVKVLLGLFTRNRGKKLDSGTLEASGTDALSDSILTLLVGVSALAPTFWHIHIDGITGVIIAAFIIKSGVEIIREALDQLLGEKADKELADEILKQIESTPDILSAHDLIINNYGPSMNIGSVNVEVEADRTFGQVYPIVHHLQMEIFHQYHIYLVFGFYSVDESSPRNRKLEQTIREYIHENPHVLGYHGLFLDEQTRELYCDVVLDFQIDRSAFRKQFEKYLQEQYPGIRPVITIDTKFY